MKALLFTTIIFCAALAASGISAAEVFITPQEREAWASVRELRGVGVNVAFIGAHYQLSIPSELRFKSVEARTFVEALARENERKVFWAREKSCAILYSGATQPEIDRFSRDLESKEATVRRRAVWHAGWMREIAVVPALLSALNDSDSEVARQARVSLRCIGWNAALLLDARTFECLCDDLKETDPALRASAAAALEFVQIGESSRVLTELEKLLGDPSKNVRERAVNSLARMKGERASAALEKAFSDIDDDIRDEAIFALASRDKTRALTLLDEWPTVGHKALRVRIEKATIKPDAEAIAVRLERQLKSESYFEHSEAVMNLASLGRDKALKLLKVACLDREADVRISAAMALGMLGGDDALKLVAGLLVDSDEGVRNSAVSALSGFRGEKVLEVFKNALKVPDELEQARVVAALGCQGSKAMPLLARALDTGSAPVRVALMYTLANMGSENAAALLEKACADSNSSVRRAAYNALEKVGGERASKLLVKAVGDPEATARRAAIAALGQLGGDQALQTLDELFSSADAATRASAISALSASSTEHGPLVKPFYKYPAALALIEKAMADSDPNVRRSAAIALGSSGLDRALEHLEKLMSDSNAGVRSGAAIALGGVGGAKAVSLLSAALNDVDKNVRVYVVYALGQAGGRETIDLIKKAFQDHDAAVRRNAAWSLNQTRNVSICAFLMAAATGEKDKKVRSDLEEILTNNYLDVDGVKEELKKLAPLP